MIRTSALFTSQSTSVCPYPSSCHNSPPVHILHARKCHHTHNSIYHHCPSSSSVYLCWCKCSVKSQMMGLILRWRLNVTILLMAVLGILKSFYKIGQSSSYHPATIWVPVLCPIPSLRSVTSEDSCNIPSWVHMVLQSIYSCQHHCDVVWTDRTDFLKCYIYLYYFWYHLWTSHLSGQQYYPYLMLYFSHFNRAPARRSIHKE